MSDPACRACADPDAREAGSLTPLSTFLLLFCGWPGRHKAPAATDAASGASIGSSEARNDGVWRGDDRTRTAVVIILMIEGADGQLTIVPPPRPPSSLLRWMLTSGSRGEMGAAEKPDLSNGAAAAKMDRSYR